jgi:predicted amidohydrolase
MKLNIAVVQFRLSADLPSQNIQRMERYLMRAEGRADVIVFPEYFLSGGIDDSIAVDSKGEILIAFKAMAQKYGIDIVAGSILEKEGENNVNVSYYIDLNGKVLGRYKKISLWKSERETIAAGKEIEVFNTRFGMVGLAICWDLIHPQLFNEMASKGAKIIYCPSLWFRGAGMEIHKKHNNEAQKLHINALCSARAIENAIVLAYANAVGKVKIGEGYDDAIGQSQITMPVIGAIKRMDEEEGMVVGEVDMSIIEEARNAYGI